MRMTLSPSSFWIWFRGFADRISSEDVPDALQEELISQIHCFDPRLFFLISTNSTPHELIVTADGNRDAFASANTLVAAAPELDNWKFIALKPPLGFCFRHTDGSISLDVSTLWFKPLKSAKDPSALGIVLGFPDADSILKNQSVDTAYTILETGLGELACAQDIAHVSVDDLSDDPGADGYLEISHLADYITFHKRPHNVG